ncbi:MAG: pilin [Minisyncoccia bacterium]
MKQKIIFLSFIFIISFTLIALGATSTSLNIPNPLGETSDIYTLIDLITKFLIGLAIVITPLIIVYAGFLYITAAGNEEKVKTAQKVLIWALIGFALVLIARGIPALIKDFLGTSSSGNSQTCANSGGNCCSDSEVCSGQVLGPCDNGLVCCEGQCTPP